VATQAHAKADSRKKHGVAHAHPPERILRVFISFTRDVIPEANAAAHIVQLVSMAVGQRTRIALESYLWNRDQPSDLGSGDAQSLINQETKKCTFFVGIMATRFGTPTARADSGMEEEYEMALRCKKAPRLPMSKLTYYFSKKKVDPDTIELDQLALVRAFREEVAEHGLYRTFSSKAIFKEQFREDLEKHVDDWYEHEQNRKKTKGHREIRREMAAWSGASAKDSYRALTAFEKVIVEATQREESVHLSGFGTFGVKERKARKGVNPKTLRAIMIPKKKAPFFKPGKSLKDAIARK
jgi:DNA-binding protein HU-beta